MSPPVPRINAFFQKTSKPIVDPISKIFIVASFILGVNRFPLLGITNTYCIVCVFVYTTFISFLFIYLTIEWNPETIIFSALRLIDSLQYLICTTLGFVLHKRLRNFYLNLNKFDSEIGINATKFGFRECVFNFLQLIVTILLSTIVYFSNGLNIADNLMRLVKVFSIKLTICYEVHYYGHLLSLIIPRLKAMNDCMKSWYPSNRNRNKPTNSPDNELQKEQKSRSDMKELMNFYNNIIIAYDSLNEAIKWLMITVLISTFTLTLCLLCYIVKAIIWGNTESHVLPVSISLMVMQLFPVLVPCVFADRVQREVRLIKDFLACKLYENTLDKPSRSTARTLLALIETRNLSFSLFHMFDIDSSLPFKFMALLLTYLIILLQFDKVISPNDPK